MLAPEFRNSQRTGFTLAELVIVVLIIGILAAAAAPRYLDSIARFRVEAAAKRIAADLRQAQRHAEKMSNPQKVVFDVALDSYNMPGMPDLDHPGIDYSVGLASTAYPADIVATAFSGAGTITFDNYGLPDGAGTVVVQSGNHSRTVQVDALGIVSVTP